MIKYLLIIGLAIFLSACSSKSNTIDLKCYSVPKSGKCKALLTKYYFDPESKTCKSFTWGGCGGNVPFQTMESCEETCK